MDFSKSSPTLFVQVCALKPRAIWPEHSACAPDPPGDCRPHETTPVGESSPPVLPWQRWLLPFLKRGTRLKDCPTQTSWAQSRMDSRPRFSLSHGRSQLRSGDSTALHLCEPGWRHIPGHQPLAPCYLPVVPAAVPSTSSPSFSLTTVTLRAASPAAPLCFPPSLLETQHLRPAAAESAFFYFYFYF